MDSLEMRQLAEVVADVLTARGLVKPERAPLHFCPQQLTVTEFGIAIQRCPKVVRRRIATRFIDRTHVFGPPYSIAREALAKFKVSFQLAAERLAAAKASAASPTRAPIPEPASQQSAA